MRKTVQTIAFDADDTLWHNERFFKLTQAHFAELLAPYTDAQTLSARLLAAERKNIGHYGFGIKGFMLSMIETAIEVTNAKVSGHMIAQIIQAGQDMLAHPIDLLPHAAEAIAAARAHGPVLLITKGDLLDQERKIAQSGLGDAFDGVHIVSAKTPETYRKIFAPLGGPETGLMVGNSMASDVVPMIEAGGFGVFVPHDLEWDLEHAPAPEGHACYRSIPDLGALPTVLADLNS